MSHAHLHKHKLFFNFSQNVVIGDNVIFVSSVLEQMYYSSSKHLIQKNLLNLSKVKRNLSINNVELKIIPNGSDYLL